MGFVNGHQKVPINNNFLEIFFVFLQFYLIFSAL